LCVYCNTLRPKQRTAQHNSSLFSQALLVKSTPRILSSKPLDLVFILQGRWGVCALHSRPHPTSTSSQFAPSLRQCDHTRHVKHVIDALGVFYAYVHVNCRNAFWNPNLNAHHPKRVHCREQAESQLSLRFVQAASRVPAAAAQQQICDSRVSTWSASTTHTAGNATPMELVVVSNKQAASHAEAEPMDARVCEHTLRKVSSKWQGKCWHTPAQKLLRPLHISIQLYSDFGAASAVHSSWVAQQHRVLTGNHPHNSGTQQIHPHLLHVFDTLSTHHLKLCYRPWEQVICEPMPCQAIAMHSPKAPCPLSTPPPPTHP